MEPELTYSDHTTYNYLLYAIEDSIVLVYGSTKKIHAGEKLKRHMTDWAKHSIAVSTPPMCLLLTVSLLSKGICIEGRRLANKCQQDGVKHNG